MLPARRVVPTARLLLGTLFPVLAFAPAACRLVRKPEIAGPPEAPSPTPTPTLEPSKGEDPQLVVKKVQEEIVVAAWAEPKALPHGGGQAQLLVRVQKRGGAAFPGVEVRFKTTAGRLYSGGKVLVTDKLGLTRDRLTTTKTATITLNAGGTRYTFQVPVGEGE
jgi:hypothetical protein